METFMKIFSDMRKSNAGNLTLGELEDKIQQFNDDEKFVLSNGVYLTGEFDSYRGYYEDLYFEFSNEDQGFNTIGQLKETINKAYEQGIMEGYKGGEFPIQDNTLVWVSTYSCSGDMIIDIQKINGTIVLIVKKETY